MRTNHTTELDLPEYDSYEDLKRQIKFAIEQGSNYFGMCTITRSLHVVVIH